MLRARAHARAPVACASAPPNEAGRVASPPASSPVAAPPAPAAPRTRRAWALAACCACAAAAAAPAGPALAAADAPRFSVGGFGAPPDSSLGGGDDDGYVYTTRDLAVDLASPLVAYRLVTFALNQAAPPWLDALVAASVAVAAAVVVTGSTALDGYLQ